MEPVRMLVSGDVNGKLAKIFKKVAAINKKIGPVEAVLCPGPFFSASDQCEKEWKECLQGNIEAPVPFYILGPTSSELEKFYSKVSLVDGGDLCQNITYLGASGIYTTVSGLQIAYIGVNLGATTNKPAAKSQSSDIEALLRKPKENNKFVGIDILLTSSWPENVLKYTNFKVDVPNASRLISMAASVLKPRYHLTSHEDHHVERLPYRNHHVLQGKQEHVTRFISLAPFLNKADKKSLYAFNICPMSAIAREELIKQPPDATEFPYKHILREMEQAERGQSSGQQQFFYDQKKLDESKKRRLDSQDDNQHRKHAKGPPTLTGPCWFCLGNPEVQRHLVISVGDHSYLALARGGLTDHHILICPIEHHHCSLALPKETLKEIEEYKDRLRKMFRSYQQGLVIFERNFYSHHLQLQVVPVAYELLEEAKSSFVEYGKLQNIEFYEVPESKSLNEVLSSTSPYFTVEFGEGTRLVHRVRSKMPLQFGREVLASPELLNLPDKVDWKNCMLSKEEESKITGKFRKDFKEFDLNTTS